MSFAEDLALRTAQGKERTRVAVEAHNQQRADEWKQQVDQIAREFLAKRTEHLADLLVIAADRGRSELVVWEHHPTASFQHDVHDAGVREGMRLVVAWLHDKGVMAEIHDDGGEMVPDYGYVHNVTLRATWEPA